MSKAERMTASDSGSPVDFAELVACHLAGELEEQGQQRLSTELAAVPERRAEFVAMCLHAQLVAACVGLEFADEARMDDVEDAEDADFDATPLAPTPTAVHSFLGNMWHGTIGFFSQEIPFSLLIATLLTGFGLWVASLVYVSSPEKIAKKFLLPTKKSFDPTLKVVGKITGMVDCKWTDPNSETFHGANVLLGRKFALASGLMEIAYETGAKVILQGPVTYEVESNGGYLAVGKLTGKMEKRSEVSVQNSVISKSVIPHPKFVIKTPTATVTDLGTEFGVAVAKDGTAEVHVYQGEVISQPCAMEAGIGAAVHVTEGHAVRIEPQNTKSVAIAFSRRLFARQISVPKEQQAEAAYRNAVLADKPLAYWPLNESKHSRRFIDWSGNGFDGSVMGDSFAVQSGPLSGKSNAVEFSGKQWIDFGRQDRFAFSMPFTIETWMWIGAMDHGRSISADPGYEFPARGGWSVGYLAITEPAIHNRGPCLLFTLYSVRDFAFDTVAVPTQQWIYVVFVCQPGKGVDLFLDGQYRASLAEKKLPIVQPVWLSIGRTAGGLLPTLPWQGRLAHIAVYEHVLTESQIKNHYQQVVGPHKQQ